MPLKPDVSQERSELKLAAVAGAAPLALANYLVVSVSMEHVMLWSPFMGGRYTNLSTRVCLGLCQQTKQPVMLLPGPCPFHAAWHTDSIMSLYPIALKAE